MDRDEQAPVPLALDGEQGAEWIGEAHGCDAPRT